MDANRRLAGCFSLFFGTLILAYVFFPTRGYAASPPTAPTVCLAAAGSTDALSPKVSGTSAAPGALSQLTSDKDIVVNASGSTSADGRAVTYKFVWYDNNVVQPALTNNTVPHDKTKKGDIWRCEVTSTDGTLNSPSVPLEIKIVNTPPKFINTRAVIDVVGNRAAQLSVKAEDADGDILTYADPVLPKGSLMDPKTRVITFVTPNGKTGTYTLNFKVSDGEASISQPVQIVNLPPMAGTDLTSYLPPVGNQGSLGSCTTWATGYYYKSFQEGREKNWDLTDVKHQCSSSFLYNQLAQGVDSGTSFEGNFDILKTQGCATLSAMPYTTNDCGTFPNMLQYEDGMPFRAQEYTYLGNPPDITVMRTHLDTGDLVVIGIPVYSSLTATGGNDVHDGARNGSGLQGYHALAIVGYDDTRSYTDANGQTCYGAFKFVNSWGSYWSTDGFSWMSYNFVSNNDTWAYYMTDRIGYWVKSEAIFHFTHQRRKDLMVKTGVGSTANPLWNKAVFSLKGTSTAQDIDAAVDLTDAAAYLPPSGGNTWYLGAMDTVAGNVGTINTFKIKYRNQSTANFQEFAATDVPISIPDAGTGYTYSYISSGIPGPNAPSNLGAAAVSASQINLSWQDNATTELGFKIERRLGSSGVWNQLTVVGANVAAYSDTGLTQSTTYYYRVKAYDAAVDSSYSNEAFATTLGVPASPANLLGQIISPTQVTLTWKDNATNETGFIIESSLDNNIFTQCGTVAANAQTFTAGALSTGMTYYFRVCANNAAGNSAYSNIVQAALTVPAAASNLTATAISTSQINLSWKDNASDETGFKVESSTDNITFTQLSAGLVGANVTTLNVTGLTSGTPYYFRVRAYNIVGNSGYSNVAQAATMATIPAVPTILSATVVSSSQIDLAWKDNSTNETGFVIQVSQLGTPWSDKATVAANTTAYSVQGLTASTTYYFQVCSYNSGGRSAPTALAQATTNSSVVIPLQPSSLTAIAVSASQIDLAWKDNSTNETGFVVQVSQLGTPWSDKATVAANTAAYSAQGLSANTTYYFQVCSVNGTTRSTPTNVAQATTPSSAVVVAPQPPSGLTAMAVSSSQIDLAWKDNSANETGFVVQVSQLGTPWSDKATVAANTAAYSAQGLSANTTYYFQVCSVNGTTRSTPTNLAQATTASGAVVVAPQPPSGLTAMAVSSSQINLAWKDNSTNETGFVIEVSQLGTPWSDKASVVANTVSYSVTGLSANTTYYFEVRSVNGTTRSTPTNLAQATTTSGAVVVAPLPPSNLTAAAVSSSQIDLVWKDNSADETGFVIEVSQLGTSWSDKASVAANTSGYSVTGLSANTTYYFEVRSVNGTTRSTPTNVAQATTSGSTVVAPQPPSSLTAAAVSLSQIDLAWKDNSTNETGFVIEVSQLGTPWSDKAAVAANTAGYSVTGLSANTTYYFEVRSVNGTTRSTPTNVAQATTTSSTGVAPQPPSNLTVAAVSSSQINLTWKDNSTNETGFVIEVSQLGTPWSDKAIVAANTTSYSVQGLNSKTTYYFEVRSVNGTTRSTPTSFAGATTL